MAEFSRINTSLAQQETFLAGTTLIGGKADGAGMNGLSNMHGKNAGEEIEQLQKRVASLESSNMALLDKLNQAQRELVAIRQGSAQVPPETGPGNEPEQAFVWERKLTRREWRSQ